MGERNELSMGITPIMDATGIADQFASSVQSVKPAESSSGDFKSVWNDQAGSRNVQDVRKDAATKNDMKADKTADRNAGETSETGKNDTYKEVKNSEDPVNASKTDVKGTDSPDTTGDEENTVTDVSGLLLKDEEIISAQEALASIVSELTVKLAEILDMSPEEFENLLQAEGIEAAGLLDRENLSSFLVNALGADSQLSLLTNEEDYAVFSEGMKVLDEALASDTGIRELTVPELKEAVAQIAADKPETMAEKADFSADDMIVQGDNVPVLKEAVRTSEKDEDVVTRFVRNSNGDLEQVGLDDNGGITGEGKIVTKVPEAGESRNDNRDRGNEDPNGGMPLQNGDVNVQAADSTSGTSVSEQTVSYTSNATEIADQILDQMKTVTDGDFSDVEMQLHPATLGTVRVHVTNNAGVITASFITENEAVKAAVESQMVRLNEQFEAQGIRVEAVEVTIASHNFEGNLESNTGSKGEETGNGTKRTRRIDLGDDGDIDTSSMEDDERIAAEMMAANGNKVDYMA